MPLPKVADLDFYGVLIGPDVKGGPSVGPMVLAWKRFIERWDPTLLSGTLGTLDDVFNRRTVAATKEPQKYWGFSPSGRVTKQTFERSLRALRDRGNRKPIEYAWDGRAIALWKIARPRVPLKRCFIFPANVPTYSLGGVRDHMRRPLGNWQSDNAIDEHAIPDSIVVAPKAGYVYKGGGHDPHGGPVGTIFGEHCTIEFDDKTAAFITHIDRVVTVGERVVVGEVIGRVGDWPRSTAMDHAHCGTRGFNPEDMRRWPRVKLPTWD